MKTRYILLIFILLVAYTCYQDKKKPESINENYSYSNRIKENNNIRDSIYSVYGIEFKGDFDEYKKELFFNSIISKFNVSKTEFENFSNDYKDYLNSYFIFDDFNYIKYPDLNNVKKIVSLDSMSKALSTKYNLDSSTIHSLMLLNDYKYLLDESY
jgi:hypothetical protein